MTTSKTFRRNQDSWSKMLKEQLERRGDTLVQICITTPGSYLPGTYKWVDGDPIFVGINDYRFCAVFDSGYGGTEGCQFTAWGEKNVYFPCCYDGSEWIECVPRNPELSPTPHFGGG